MKGNLRSLSNAFGLSASRAKPFGPKSFSAFVLILLIARLDAPALDRPETKAMQIDGLPDWKTIFSSSLWQRADSTAVSLQAPLNVIFLAQPEATKVRILWCRSSLLVRFDCDDQSIVLLPGSDRSKPQRDQLYFKADSAEVFLDPVGDSKMYMEFEFSPNNGIFDAIYFCTGEPRSQSDFMLEDDVADRELFSIKEWNLDGLRTASRVWLDSKTHGWSVIAAFPAREILKRLGKTEFTAGTNLKFNFVRFNYYSDGRQSEITNWAPVLAGCAHVSPAGMGRVILESGN